MLPPIRPGVSVAALVLLGAPCAAQAVLLHREHDHLANHFGYAVASAGDVDRDGVPDWLASAPYYNPNSGGVTVGQVRVFSGRDGDLLHLLAGGSQSDWFGTAVAGLGDVDADGFDDFAIGASGEDDPSGAEVGGVHVFSGEDGSLLYTSLGAHPDSNYGYSLSAVGDVDGDGASEWIVGAPGHNPAGSQAGAAFLVSGQSGGLLLSVTGTAGDRLGRSVAGAGDVDADGVPDVVIGAPDADGLQPDSGKAIVLSGATGNVLHELLGFEADSGFGRAVAGAGDVDGDGHDDVVVGAYQSNQGATGGGSAYVLSGKDGGVLFELHGTQRFDHLGNSVAGLGDVDGDGRPDVAVGAYWSDQYDFKAGLVYVLSGDDGSILYRLHGEKTDGLGTSVAGAGDVNGDGLGDLLVGAARWYYLGGPVLPGYARLYAGTPQAGEMVCLGAGCPCTNDYAFGGCANSSGELGATLWGTGSSSLTNDDLVLQAAHLPPASRAVLVLGSDAGTAGVGLGAGLSCVSPPLARYAPFTTSVTGTASLGPGLAALASIGGLAAGTTWTFQLWYFDPSGPCLTVLPANLSNGVRVTWTP